MLQESAISGPITSARVNIRSEVLPGKGKGLVAGEDIPAGKLLLAEDPLALALEEDTRASRCSWCLIELGGETSSILRCSGCTFIYYCSQTCQRKDWGEHKGECKIWRENKHSPPMRIRLMGRVCRLPAASEKTSSFKSLCHHEEDLNNKERVEYGQMVMALFSTLVEADRPASPKEALALCSRVASNAFTIFDASMDRIGSGIYPRASLLNHSCIPNCSMHWVGRKIHIRSLEKISAGSELTISYVDPFELKDARDAYFLSAHFKCTCPACHPPNRKMREAYELSGSEEVDGVVRALVDMRHTIPLEHINSHHLPMVRDNFPDHHAGLVAGYRRLIRAYIDKGDWRAAWAMSESLSKAFEKALSPSYTLHPLYVVQVWATIRLKMQLMDGMNRKVGLQYYKEAYETGIRFFTLFGKSELLLDQVGGVIYDILLGIKPKDQ